MKKHRKEKRQTRNLIKNEPVFTSNELPFPMKFIRVKRSKENGGYLVLAKFLDDNKFTKVVFDKE